MSRHKSYKKTIEQFYICAMPSPIICIGAALVDELFHAAAPMLPSTTNDATVHRSAGGVSRNIAHQLALLDLPVQLICVLGNDGEGDWLRQVCEAAGIGLDGALSINNRTGKYTAILNQDGSLYTALITNSSVHLITPEHLQQQAELLSTAALIVADANINTATAQWLAAFGKQHSIPFIIEPVSVPPAAKYANMDLSGVNMITPNEDELPAMCSNKSSYTQQQVEELLGRGVEKIWLHNGAKGSVLYSKDKIITLQAPQVEVLDCTGAGDGSLSGWILAKYLGKEDEDCLKIAHTLSAEILQVNGAIATHLNQEKLLQRVPVYYPD
jgi:pseudouridine kinase